MRILIIIVIFTFFSCKNDCPKNQEEWDEFLNKSSLYKISHINTTQGYLEIMWDGKVNDANLPIEKDNIFEQLKNSFNTNIYERDTLVDSAKLIFIKSEAGSKILYSKEFGIVELEIIEPIKEMLGEKIKIGMSRADFILLFFDKYNTCFDNITKIVFPYGMNDNGLKFEFREGKLNKVSIVNYPD